MPRPSKNEAVASKRGRVWKVERFMGFPFVVQGLEWVPFFPRKRGTRDWIGHGSQGKVLPHSIRISLLASFRFKTDQNSRVITITPKVLDRTLYKTVVYVKRYFVLVALLLFFFFLTGLTGLTGFV